METRPIDQETLLPTRNNTPEEVKQETIKLLNHLLADFLSLALDTKQAHWNMRGKTFIAVHEMLDPFHKQLMDYADELAERIAQLGGVAYGTPDLIASESSFEAYPTNIHCVRMHLTELSVRYGALANALRAVVDKKLCDEGTLNLVTDMSNTLDKYLWFIEAHLTQAEEEK